MSRRQQCYLAMVTGSPAHPVVLAADFSRCRIRQRSPAYILRFTQFAALPDCIPDIPPMRVCNCH